MRACPGAAGGWGESPRVLPQMSSASDPGVEGVLAQGLSWRRSTVPQYLVARCERVSALRGMSGGPAPRGLSVREVPGHHATQVVGASWNDEGKGMALPG